MGSYSKGYCLQVYSEMDCLARQALAAVCRSCHLRLRSDTFSSILDDCPMQPGVSSSSTLQCLQYVNNFSLRSHVGDNWTLAMTQEGVLNKSLVTVIAVNDTRQGTSPNVCKLQVTPLYVCTVIMFVLLQTAGSDTGTPRRA